MLLEKIQLHHELHATAMNITDKNSNEILAQFLNFVGKILILSELR
jgi:hypothetical protein